MPEIKGTVAVVTGGASGIGLATARLLAERGATVWLLDIAEDTGPEAADQVGGRFVKVDVAEPASWAAALEVIERDAGGVDLAHLNAGVTTGESDITAVTDKQYRRIMGSNVDGVVFGVRALVPSMSRRGGGAIVATASLAGLVAYSADPIYALTKHAVVGLVRALGPQLEEKGITINAVCPGIVDTPLVGEDAKAFLEAAGFPVIPAAQIAEAVVACMEGVETGLPWVCQAGREKVAYEHRRVPGPRVGGATGIVPPRGVGGHDQYRD
jgi:NAD(P)-dependent dehydrogenase (short-subunit alcohol dehydrogenase family)